LRPAPHKYWRFLYTCAWITFLVDLATKSWAVSVLSNREPVQIIGSLLQLTFIRNPGAAFSFATGSTVLFSLFALVVIVVITYVAPRIIHRGWALVLGLLLGGVLGNFSDRIFRSPGFLQGHVIDWIEIPHWPIFNVADSAIVLAAGISIILSARNIAPVAPKDNRPDQPGAKK
jgi:signal peptidase II